MNLGENLFLIGAAFTLAVLLNAMTTVPVIQSTALGRKKKAMLLLVLWCIPYLGYVWVQKVLVVNSPSGYRGGGSASGVDAYGGTHHGTDIFGDARNFSHSGNCGDIDDAGDSGSCGDDVGR